MLDYGFYNLDCMQGMKEFPDKYFDLAIVDPPYGISDDGISMKGGSCGKLKNRVFTHRSISKWDHAPDKLYFEELFRVSKKQVIWGGNYFSLPPCRCFVIWDKLQPWENFSRCEYAWTNIMAPAKIYQQDNRYSGKIHPTQKPVELYEWLINKFSEEGDTILDTHVGSASSLIACHRTRHKYVGFEIDKDYYEKASKRLKEEQAQLSVWDYMEGT